MNPSISNQSASNVKKSFSLRMKNKREHNVTVSQMPFAFSKCKLDTRLDRRFKQRRRSFFSHHNNNFFFATITFFQFDSTIFLSQIAISHFQFDCLEKYDRQTVSKTDRQTDTQSKRQIDRQTDRQTNRRQTVKQTYRQSFIEIHCHHISTETKHFYKDKNEKKT